jgi:hypothetical protein
MSITENFEKLLKNFFLLYHPRQLKKVGIIVQEFRGQEIMLLKVLCDRYKKAYTIIPGLNEKLEELYADPPESEKIDDTLSEESTKEGDTVAEEIVAIEEKEDTVAEEIVAIEEEEVVTETEEEEEDK